MKRLHALSGALLMILTAAGLSARAADEVTVTASGAGQVEAALALFDIEAASRHRKGHIELRGARAASEAGRRAARALLTGAANKGDERAMFLLALMLDGGFGGPRDQAGARALYARSRQRLGVWYLGRMHEQGAGGPRDLARARAFYKDAAERGQIDARYDYARMLRAGLGGPADKAEARRLLVSVTEFCHGDGNSDLADMAERGEGGPRDSRLAAEKYVRAVSCHNEFFRKPTLPRGFARLPEDTRRAIQTFLADPSSGGRYAGPVDGRWRPALNEALRRAE